MIQEMEIPLFVFFFFFSLKKKKIIWVRIKENRDEDEMDKERIQWISSSSYPLENLVRTHDSCLVNIVQPLIKS